MYINSNPNNLYNKRDQTLLLIINEIIRILKVIWYFILLYYIIHCQWQILWGQ